MGKSASDELRELEEHHNQVEGDIAIYKDKLIVQRSRLLAEYERYEYLRMRSCMIWKATWPTNLPAKLRNNLY